jgi:hypothetical protein
MFFFSYIVWTRKGYQRFLEPRGSSVIKVKGIGRVYVSHSGFYTGKYVVGLKNFVERQMVEKFSSTQRFVDIAFRRQITASIESEGVDVE